MNDEERSQEALFRHAVLGEVLSRSLRRGELRPLLQQLAEQTFTDERGRPRRMAVKTLEQWVYQYRQGGWEALQPQPRRDRGSSRVLASELVELVVALKREDPGRSAYLILRELAHVCGFLTGAWLETRMKSRREGYWAEFHRGTQYEEYA